MQTHDLSILDRISHRQPIFILSILLVGVGNLIVPESLNSTLIGHYLIIALVSSASALFFLIPIVIKNGWYIPIVIFLFLGFVPGFLITDISSYGNLKLLSFLIALLLITAPSGFHHPDNSIHFLLTILTILSAIFSILLLLNGIQGNIGRDQIDGLNPIGIARVTAIACLLPIAALLVNWRSIRPFRFILLMVSTLGMIATIATGSRGPLLAILISLTVLSIILVVIGHINPVVIPTLLVFGIGILFIVQKISLDGFTRILTATDSGRKELYLKSLDLALQNPLGIGWGNLADYIPFPNQAIQGRLYSHNIILETAVEGGWIAALSFVALVILAIINQCRSIGRGSTGSALVLTMLLYLLVNAMVSSDLVGNRLLWLFIGLALLPNSSLTPTNISGHTAKWSYTPGSVYSHSNARKRTR